MFNSLKCAKKLEEAGVPREQAEANIQIISEMLDMNLASKEDVRELRQDFSSKEDVWAVKQDIALLEQKLLQLEQRMTIKLGTIVSIAVGLAVTLAKLVG